MLKFYNKNVKENVTAAPVLSDDRVVLGGFHFISMKTASYFDVPVVHSGTSPRWLIVSGMYSPIRRGILKEVIGRYYITGLIILCLELIYVFHFNTDIQV